MHAAINGLPPGITDVLVFFDTPLTGRGQAAWPSRQPGKSGTNRTVVDPNRAVAIAYGLFIAGDAAGQFGNWQRWTRDHHVAPQLVGPVWPPPPGTPGHDPSPPMREPEIWAEQMRADLTWVRRSRDQANDDNTRAIHDNTRAIIGGHPVIGRHVIMLGQPGDNTWRPDDLLLLIAVKSGRVGARVVLLFRPDEALLDWLAHAHSERRDAQFIYPTREPSAVGPVLSRPVVPNPRHRHRGRAQIPGGGLPPSLGHPGPARRHPRADHHLGRWRNADPHHPAGHYTRHRPRRTRRPRRPGRAPRHQHGAASRRGRRGRRDSRRSD